MKVVFEVSEVIPTSPGAVYQAWLDSEQHSGMTGGHAEVSDKVGDTFKAWDGYIEGTNLELNPNIRILQRWRTSEFKETEDDSILKS